jgi:hypothetical protein
MAWVFDRYVTDRRLCALQDEARAAHCGLWADAQPMAPWKCRATRRPLRRRSGLLQCDCCDHFSAGCSTRVVSYEGLIGFYSLAIEARVSLASMEATSA